MTGPSSAQMPSRSAEPISASEARFSRGWLWRIAWMLMITIMPSAISKPGTMPDRNSLEIDCSAITPQITKAMDGGINGARMPAETTSAVA